MRSLTIFPEAQSWLGNHHGPASSSQPAPKLGSRGSRKLQGQARQEQGQGGQGDLGHQRRLGTPADLRLVILIPKTLDIVGCMGNIFGEQPLSGWIPIGQLQAQVKIAAVLSLNSIPGPVNGGPEVGNLPGLGEQAQAPLLAL